MTTPALAMPPPEDIAKTMSETCVEKAHRPLGAMAGLGILAGAYIGFGSLMAAPAPPTCLTARRNSRSAPASRLA